MDQVPGPENGTTLNFHLIRSGPVFRVFTEGATKTHGDGIRFAQFGIVFFTLASAAESFQEGRDRAKRSIEHIG